MALPKRLSVSLMRLWVRLPVCRKYRRQRNMWSVPWMCTWENPDSWKVQVIWPRSFNLGWTGDCRLKDVKEIARKSSRSIRCCALQLQVIQPQITANLNLLNFTLKGTVLETFFFRNTFQIEILRPKKNLSIVWTFKLIFWYSAREWLSSVVGCISFRNKIKPPEELPMMSPILLLLSPACLTCLEPEETIASLAVIENFRSKITYPEIDFCIPCFDHLWLLSVSLRATREHCRAA